MEKKVSGTDDVCTELWNAWSTRDGLRFCSAWKNVKDKKFIESIMSNIILDFTHAGFYFAKVIFDNNGHRGIFQKDKSLAMNIIEFGNWPILELLLQYDTNLRKTAENGNSLLHYLCAHNWDKFSKYYGKCMKLLLANKEIDINALNNDRLTPLDLAIETNNSDAVELLLEMGNQLYLDGFYPGRLSTRQQLLKSYPGIDDNLPPFTGNKMNRSELSRLLVEKDEKLFMTSFHQALHEGAVISQNDKHIMLQKACQYNLLDVVQLLLNYGADASFADKWNDFQSANLIALETGNLKLLAILLERSAMPDAAAIALRGRNIQFDINQKDVEGNTVMHYACQRNNERAIFEILKAGSYLGAKINNDESPLLKIPTRVLKKFFDYNIKFGKDDEIVFTYDFFARPIETKDTVIKTSPELKLQNQMSEIQELRQLLTHPVLNSFILLKWQKFQKIYWMNFLFHLLLILLFTFNIIWLSTTGQDLLSIPRDVQTYFIILLILRQFFLASIYRKRYFLQMETFLDWGLIFTAGFLVIEECTSTDLCCIVAPALLLLSWFRFLLLIAKHPRDWAPVKSAIEFSLHFVKCLTFGLFAISALISITGTTEFLSISMPSLVAIGVLYCSNDICRINPQLTVKEALIHVRVTQIKYLTTIEEILLELNRVPVLGLVSKWFLKFGSEFSSNDFRDKSKFFYGYEIDQSIFDVARTLQR